MNELGLGVLAVKELAYEVQLHRLRNRSFRVIIAIHLLQKHLPYPVTTKLLAKLYGVKTFSSDSSLRNAVDSGYLYKVPGDKSRGWPNHYMLSEKGKELIKKYSEQCQMFEQRFNGMVNECKAIFDFRL